MKKNEIMSHTHTHKKHSQIKMTYKQHTGHFFHILSHFLENLFNKLLLTTVIDEILEH